MQIYSKGKLITLSEEQEEAVIRSFDYLKTKNSEKSFFGISGSAGSGKTTVLKECINRYNGSVVITAPTHKAKRIVGNLTGIESITIHKLLGLRPDMDLLEFDQRNVLFSTSGNNTMHLYDLICIDEASMLNTPLLELIKKSAKLNKIKIIFLGDPNQLSPVKEKFSPVFVDEDIEFVYIKKLQRQQNGNPLISIYDSIISNINSEKDLFLHETNIIENKGIKFFNNEIRLFGEKALEQFSSEDYKNNIDFCKILSFENNVVKQWNNLIRKNIYSEDKIFGSPIICGEILMAYRSIFDTNRGVNVIENSSEYKVLNTSFEFKEKMYGQYVDIQNLDNDETSSVFILNREFYNEFANMEQKLANKAKDCKDGNRKWLWSLYYEYRNKFLLIENIYDNNGYIRVKKDFDFAYSLTIHKSQGSTYTNVFVDEKNINQTYISSQDRNRLKYVAFTRPTNIAYVNS